jgi:hypothetical protein
MTCPLLCIIYAATVSNNLTTNTDPTGSSQRSKLSTTTKRCAFALSMLGEVLDASMTVNRNRQCHIFPPILRR